MDLRRKLCRLEGIGVMAHDEPEDDTIPQCYELHTAGEDLATFVNKEAAEDIVDVIRVVRLAMIGEVEARDQLLELMDLPKMSRLAEFRTTES